MISFLHNDITAAAVALVANKVTFQIFAALITRKEQRPLHKLAV